MRYLILALVTFGCSSALAQAPPRKDAQAASPKAQDDARSIKRSASSEPSTAERQVGGLEPASFVEAKPAAAVMGADAANLDLGSGMWMTPDGHIFEAPRRSRP